MKAGNLWIGVATLLAASVAGLSLVTSGCQSAEQAATTGSSGIDTTDAGISSKDLYRQAIEKSITENSQDISASFEMDSGNVKVQGIFAGSPSGKTGRMQADAQINSTMKGIPMSKPP